MSLPAIAVSLPPDAPSADPSPDTVYPALVALDVVPAEHAVADPAVVEPALAEHAVGEHPDVARRADARTAVSTAPVMTRAVLRTRIANATLVARAVAARALAAGVLSDNAVGDFKALVKAGRMDRLKSLDTLTAAAHALEQHAVALASRLTDGDAVLSRAHETVHAAAARKAGVGKAKPRVMRSAAILRAPIITNAEIAVVPSAVSVTALDGESQPSTKPARASTQRRFPSLDELTDDQRAVVANLRDLMTRMDGGLTVAEGLAFLDTEAGLIRKPRWLKRLRARWRQHGESGLYDWRWVRDVAPQVSEAVRNMTITWYFTRRGAGPKVVHELVADSCAKDGLAPPSYAWVKLFLRSLPAGYKVARAGGIEAWTRAAAPVGVFSPTTYANEQWQIDNCRTDIWIRVQQRDGSWVPSEVWLTAVIDVHSRAIMGYLLYTGAPTAWTTAMAIRQAILPKAAGDWPMHGVPAIITTDHGKDFTAASVRSSIRALGIRFDLCAPNYPNMKGEIERWFGTFQRGHLAKHPGYKGGGMQSAGAAAKHVMELLTRDGLDAELRAWITNVYHTRVHEGISVGPLDQKPGTLWTRSVRLRTVERRDLDVLVLKCDVVRTISNLGIRFSLPQHRNQVFWHPALADIDVYRAKVRIRYNPHDLKSVIVYRADSNERICEAFRVSRTGADGEFTIAEIKVAAAQARRGVAERLHDAEVLRRRDVAASPEAWAQAEALADTVRTPRSRTASGGGATSVTTGPRAAPSRAPSRAADVARPPAPRVPATTPRVSKQDEGVLSLMDLMQRKMRGLA